MLTAILAILIACVAGGTIYALAKNPKASEMGRLLLFVAMFFLFYLCANGTFDRVLR